MSARTLLRNGERPSQETAGADAVLPYTAVLMANADGTAENAFVLKPETCLNIDTPRTTAGPRAAPAYICQLPRPKDPAKHTHAFATIWQVLYVEGQTLTVPNLRAELRKAGVKGVNSDVGLRSLLHEFRHRLASPVVYFRGTDGEPAGVRWARNRAELVAEIDRDAGRGVGNLRAAATMDAAATRWLSGDRSALQGIEPAYRPFVDSFLARLEGEPVSAKDMARQLDDEGFNTSDAGPGSKPSPWASGGREPGVKVRNLAHRLLIEHGIPICTSAQGLYLPKTRADVERDLEHRTSRARENEARGQMLSRIGALWFPATPAEKQARDYVCSQPPRLRAPSPRWAKQQANAARAKENAAAAMDEVSRVCQDSARLRRAEIEDRFHEVKKIVEGGTDRQRQALTPAQWGDYYEGSGLDSFLASGEEPSKPMLKRFKWSWVPSNVRATPAGRPSDKRTVQTKAGDTIPPMPWK